MKINYENNAPIRSIVIVQPDTLVVTSGRIKLLPETQYVIRIDSSDDQQIFVDVRRATEFRDALTLLINQLEKNND